MKMDKYWNIRCEHCGIPDKALWTAECKWFDIHYNNGGDPPCSFDEYDKNEIRRDKSRFRNNVLFIGIILTIFIVIGFIIV